MKNIIFIAPPAAGKGTISSMICSKYNIPHISIGEIFRDEISKSTKNASKIKEAMYKGVLVDDDITAKVIKKRLTNSDCKKGFIMDGYPRSMAQANSFDSILKELSYDECLVILLDISKEEALKRTMSRLTCQKCNISYNTSNPDLSPIRDGICDLCSENLTRRKDDTEEMFEVRYNIYINETCQVIDYYRNKNQLVVIDATYKSPDEIFEEIKKVIK